MGHQFTIIASTLTYLTGQPAVHNVAEDGVRVLRAYTFGHFRKTWAGRAAAWLSFMIFSFWAGMRSGKADLVIGTSPPMPQAFSSWLLAALWRKPFLLEIRDLWPDFAIGMGVLRNGLLIALARQAERFLYARAGHILVNSPAYRDHLERKGITPDKITLISNGADVSAFEGGSACAFRERWGLQGATVIMYAGALGLANDVSTLLRAAHRLSTQAQIQWLILGDGPERDRLMAEAAAMRMTNLQFPGAIPKTEMRDALAAADICVATLQNIPMFETTYPNKVFDYMAAGKPVVLAIRGVIEQVIENAGAGICVAPGDDAALADAILRLSGDPHRARVMGDAGRQYVSRNFNRTEQSQAFERLLGKMYERTLPVRGAVS